MQPLPRSSHTQKQDRLLSLAAWVVVAGLTGSSGVFLVDQILRSPERPAEVAASPRRALPATVPLALSGSERRTPASSDVPQAPADPAATRPTPVDEPPAARSRARVTLEIGSFADAGEAVRFGVELGLPGHLFTPMQDPRTKRHGLRFGEFADWKDALPVLEAIRAKRPALDVRIWPLRASRADGAR